MSLLSNANAWKGSGWAYIADCSKMDPVGPEEGGVLVEMTKKFVAAGCKAFAFVEGYAFAFAFFGKNASPTQYLYIALVLTAGTSFLLWLGDQISKKGLGNGISLIIMAGIIATLPQMFIDVFKDLITFSGTAQVITLGIVKFLIFVIIYYIFSSSNWL